MPMFKSSWVLAAAIATAISLSSTRMLGGTPREASARPDDVCTLSLLIAEAACPFFLGCAGNEDGCGKGLFHVSMLKVNKNGENEIVKREPAFGKEVKCENAKFRYMHMENALKGQKGVRIGLKNVDGGYEFDFSWGNMGPPGGMYFCGHYSGKATKKEKSWELNCGTGDCSVSGVTLHTRRGDSADDRITSHLELQSALRIVERMAHVDLRMGELEKHVARNDWKAAEWGLDEIYEKWRFIKFVAMEKGAPPATVKLIDSAVETLMISVRDRRSFDAEDSANLISSGLPSLVGFWVKRIPIDVMRLKPAFRQLQIRVSRLWWAQAQETVETVEQLWAALRPIAETHLGTTQNLSNRTVVAEMDSVITDTRSSVARKDKNSALAATEKGMRLAETITKMVVENKSVPSTR